MFVLVWFVVLNAIFDNISVISLWSVLLVEEIKVPRENQNVKYLEMLNTLKIVVPEIKETISRIQDHLTEANNLFQPFWVKLSKTQDKLDLTENQNFLS
jgi:hypothetical protein